MVTNISYNVMINRLRAFADGHYLIKKFSHGQIDLRYLEQDADYYPWMHVIPGTITPREGLREYSFDITFSDLTRDKEHEAEYIREAISDCTRLAEDLLAEIKNGNTLFDPLVQSVDGSTITPFIHEDTHTLTGVTLSLSIRVPWNWSACDIPADYAPGGSGSGGGAIGGCCVTLQVEGTDNVDQTLLNLVAGTNMTITDNGDGSVTFDSSGGGGGGGELVALEWSADHISATGNEYEIGDFVWYIGNVYECIANNDSILPTNTSYWTLVGAGNRLRESPTDWNSTSGDNQILNKPTLATVATSGDYNDLTNLPTIPAAQVNSDWNAVGGVAEILNKPTIPVVTGFVPYTGATQDVDLDANKLSAESIYIEGTNGNGHLHLKHQSADATATGQSTSLWANNDGDIKWKNDNDYKTTLKTSLNTADRVYTFPDEDATLVSTSRQINTSSPLSGGGDLSADRTLSITQATTSTDGYLSSSDFNNFNTAANQQRLQIFGDASTAGGTTTINSAVVLSADAYYYNLTITTGGSIDLNGWRLFVQNTLNLTNAGASSIHNNGTTGSIGVGFNGGSNGTGNGGRTGKGKTVYGGLQNGSAGTTGEYLGGNGGAGGTAGGNGVAGIAPTAATSTALRIGGAGGAGGKGGNAGFTGGNGGAAQTNATSVALTAATSVVRIPQVYSLYIIQALSTPPTVVTNQIHGGLNGGGGGGGSSSATNSGVQGGCGGGGGGNTFVFAYSVTVAGTTSSSAISSNGGNGGNGANSANNNTGAGGGAGAGGGGYVVLICNSISTNGITFISANGGTGGTGGNALGTGIGGNGGFGGNGGRITVIRIKDGTVTQVDGTGGTVGTPTTATTTTGTAGSSGITTTYTS